MRSMSASLESALIAASVTGLASARTGATRTAADMEVDLVDEILRFHGIDKVPAQLPAIRASRDVGGGASCGLAGPGPDAAELDALLTIASRVPDHGKLAPWRFIVIAGAARDPREAGTRALGQSDDCGEQAGDPGRFPLGEEAAAGACAHR